MTPDSGIRDQVSGGARTRRPPPARAPRPRAARRGFRFSGFTLVEVLIALVVVALALLALTRTAALQVQAFDGLRERTLASWVATNALAETRLASRFPPTGRSEGHARLADRDWRWTREVKATSDAGIRRIDIRVFASEATEPSATLSGFAGQGLSP